MRNKVVESLLKNEAPRSWTEYRSRPADERWEIIGGEAFPGKTETMAASPLYPHQHIVLNLALELKKAVGKGPCRVILSPFDVRFSESDCVEPDVMVVCRPERIKLTHVEGAPELVVEVVSPASVRYDRIHKLKLYAHYGVREYWIVTLDEPLVEVLMLDGATYRMAGVYGKQDTVRSHVLPKLRLPVDRLFDFPGEMMQGVRLIRETRAVYTAKRKRRVHYDR